MNHKGIKSAVQLSVFGMAMLGTACGGQKETMSTAAISPEVVVYTEVTPGGQFPQTMTVTYEVLPEGEINVADYVMKGEATNWMDPDLHDFSATFSDVSVSDNTLTFTFGEFADKYFFVDNWTVTNTANDALSFSSEMINRVVTPVADEFVEYDKGDGENFHYQLFTPADTSKPQPIVVVFHGFADTHNLRAYRTSVAWAEPEAQEQRPCYVLSPIIDDNDYYSDNGRQKVFEALYEKLQAMIQDGLVDENRIYIMGNSFGGMSTIEFMEKYPEVPAAGLALCSALEYSSSATGALDRITEIPLWIAQAENDGTIPSSNSKNMYETLTGLGDSVVQLTIYSDEEMNAAGGSSDPNSTFSYHHVEMAVMEDVAYAEWLFAQSK